jgi:hypothetical protein
LPVSAALGRDSPRTLIETSAVWPPKGHSPAIPIVTYFRPCPRSDCRRQAPLREEHRATAMSGGPPNKTPSRGIRGACRAPVFTRNHPSRLHRDATGDVCEYCSIWCACAHCPAALAARKLPNEMPPPKRRRLLKTMPTVLLSERRPERQITLNAG